MLPGFSARAQSVFLSSMGVGDVKKAATLTTQTAGFPSSGALMPVSGYSQTAVPVIQLEASNGKAYFGNVYGGVLQVMPVAMTFTKMNAIINPQNTQILIGVRLTVTAQLYRFQRQGGSGQLVAVPGAACTFVDASTLQAPNPTQTYENIVPPGELGVCSAAFSATIPAGDSLIWLISMTASSTIGASLTQSLSIDASISLATLAAQTLTFGVAPMVTVNGIGSVNATSATPNSGNAIAYSTNSTDCSVTSAGVVTGINAGTNNCVIVATQTGDANYATGTATQTLSIGQAVQTLAFGVAPTLVVNGTGTVRATSASPNSSNAITYSTSSTDCSVTSAGVVTGINAGTNNCVVVATQASNTNYAQGTATQILSIGKANQTIAFPAQSPLSHAFASNGTFVIAPPATSATPNSGNAIAYSSLTGSVCSVSGTTVTMLGAGTCTIAADQAGNANYDAAATVMQSVAIGTAAQTLSFGAAPAVMVNGTGSVSATSANPNSGNPITYSTSSSDCSVTSTGVVTGINAGTNNCAVLATQAGNTNYAQGAAMQTLSIGKANQTIAFPAQSPPSHAFASNGTFVIAPPATSATPNSGNTIAYSSLTGSVCSVSGTTLTMLNVGTCTIAADQSGNANYNAAATVTQSVAIGLAAQTLSFGAAPVVVVNGTGSVSATSASPNSGNPITYSTSSSDCSVTSTGVVSGINAGTNNCSVVAMQAGNKNYAQGTATQTLNIGKANQTIVFPTQNPASHAFVPNGSFAINPPATSATPNSGNAITYSSLTGSVCSVSGTALTMLNVGACTIAADQADNANYNAAAQVVQNVAIGLASQSISSFVAAPASPTFAAEGTFTVSASGGGSGNPVTFSIATASAGVCSAGGTNGATITMLGAGTCTLLANQAGNTRYAAATQATLAVTIARKTTTITLAAAPTAAQVGQTITITATVTGDPPTGTVTFCNNATTIDANCTGGTRLCSAVQLVPGTTSSTAVCTTSFAVQGTQMLSGFYAGDANFTATATTQMLALAVEAQTPVVPAPALTRYALALLSLLLGLVGWTRRYSK
ncbi:MAG: Ig-like domain repeat protein [Rudaea sp.]|nr:Ig-like domain repeat protein [Rudaea sp.]